MQSDLFVVSDVGRDLKLSTGVIECRHGSTDSGSGRRQMVPMPLPCSYGHTYRVFATFIGDYLALHNGRECLWPPHGGIISGTMPISIVFLLLSAGLDRIIIYHNCHCRCHCHNHYHCLCHNLIIAIAIVTILLVKLIITLIITGDPPPTLESSPCVDIECLRRILDKSQHAGHSRPKVTLIGRSPL